MQRPGPCLPSTASYAQSEVSGNHTVGRTIAVTTPAGVTGQPGQAVLADRLSGVGVAEPEGTGDRDPDGERGSAGGTPSFGTLLRHHRERVGMTQERLAQQAAISERTVRNLETGRVQRPHRDSVRLLAAALGLVGAERAEFEGASWNSGWLGSVGGQAVGLNPCQLPADVPDFTGRDETVALLDRVLSEPVHGTVPVAVVSGSPGVGKTALALRMAHRLRDRFPDGQFYVDLRGAGPTPVPPAAALDALLRALGVAGSAVPAEAEERTTLLRATLDGRRALLVLDDAAGEAQLRPLLPGTGGCAVVVTSRRRLTGLDGARLVPLGLLSPAEARRLLARVAGPPRVAAEPVAADDVVRLAGGLPLAVRIAAARLAARPTWSLRRLADLLEDERRRLDELRTGDLEIRAGLELSYRALDHDQRRAFRLLGLLDAPDLPAWVAGAVLDQPVEQAVEVVEALVDAHLLEADLPDATDGVRYRFHGLLRAYARDRSLDADSGPERQAAVERAVSGWLALADRAEQRLPSDTLSLHPRLPGSWSPDPALAEQLTADPVAWFGTERRALLAAVRQAAADGHARLATDLADALVDELAARGHADEWSEAVRTAMRACADAGDHVGLARMRHRLGELAIYRCRFDEAATMLDRALQGFVALDDRAGQASVLISRGAVDRVRGDFDRAARRLGEAARLFVQLGHRGGAAYADTEAAIIHRTVGRYEVSLSLMNRALAVFRQLDDRRGMSRALLGLAAAHEALGDVDRAGLALHRSMAASRGCGDRRAIGFAQYALGDFELRHGSAATARGLLEEALRSFREMGSADGVGLSQRSLGLASGAAGDAADAQARLSSALGIFRELGSLLWQARTLRDLSALAERAGDHGSAVAALREAGLLFERLGAPEAAGVASQLAELHPDGGGELRSRAEPA